VTDLRHVPAGPLRPHVFTTTPTDIIDYSTTNCSPSHRERTDSDRERGGIEPERSLRCRTLAKG
jgi:hypothetical protein